MNVLALVEDGEPSQQTLTLARAFGDVHSVPADAVTPFAPDALAAILQRAADDLEVGAVLAAGTDRGNDVIARLAARTGLPLAANVVAADPSGAVTRQRWGGSLLESARIQASRLLITVAPFSVRTAPGPAPTSVDVERYVAELDPRDLVVRVQEHIDPPGGGVSLAEAKVVVSGGRGVGSSEGFAINSDPEAPIMSLADYSVVGDLKEVVPAISAEIRRLK